MEEIDREDQPMQPTFKSLLEKGKTLIGKTFTLGGWARSVRKAEKGTLLFLQLSDGSCHKDLQIIIKQSDNHLNYDEIATGNVGWSFRVTGTFVDSGLNEKGEEREQSIEMIASSVEILGNTTDYKQYPLQKRGKEERKKGIPIDRLREIPHLRSRTYLFGDIFRLRNCLAMATHDFFQSRECMWVSTPVITFSDCEGAGEAFVVTTDEDMEDMVKRSKLSNNTAISESGPNVAVSSGNSVAMAGVSISDKEFMDILDKKGKEELVSENEHPMEKHFFRQKAFLTVSGQLEGEAIACGMTRIYTFGPTFRAEKSKTSRHMNEFWMVEPELAFITFDQLMSCAESYVTYSIQCALEKCSKEIDYLGNVLKSVTLEALKGYVDKPFIRLSYTEAIDILQKAGKEVSWGDDLCSDFEKYLTDEVYKHPVIVHGYPTDLKSFYMKPDPETEGKTVQAFDLLVPGVGELIGGSMREENYDALKSRMETLKMDLEPYKEYLELREYGTVPHGGFGLGFERLVKFVGGIPNIRDTIFFPRSY
jgi:asparaginyl-tRNA synthetase